MSASMNCVVIIHCSEIITCNIIKSQNKEIFYWIIVCDDVSCFYLLSLCLCAFFSPCVYLYSCITTECIRSVFVLFCFVLFVLIQFFVVAVDTSDGGGGSVVGCCLVKCTPNGYGTRSAT